MCWRWRWWQWTKNSSIVLIATTLNTAVAAGSPDLIHVGMLLLLLLCGVVVCHCLAIIRVVEQLKNYFNTGN